MKRHAISFRHAFNGLVLAFNEQPNLKIHLFFSFASLLLGYLLGLSTIEWVILIFTITLVFIAEMVNTTIEAVTDLLTDKWHADAKKAKDVGAGMVLVSVGCAALIGLFLFVPKILVLIE